jgi:predicted permease
MNLVGTGNQIGQSIALMRLVVAIIVGCCFCSFGGGIFMSKPKDENDNPKRAGMIFMSMGGCAILLAYLTYLFTKSFKGAGTMYTAFSAYDALTGNK